MSYIPASVKCDKCPKVQREDNGTFYRIWITNGVIHALPFDTDITNTIDPKEKHACSPECAGEIVTFLLKENKGEQKCY